jgi:predicted nucleotidyltransferase
MSTRRSTLEGAALGSLPDDLRQALDEAVPAIIAVAHPQRIILFGSWAKGTGGPESDVDLLVVAETHGQRWDLTHRVYAALLPLFRQRGLDLLVYSPASWEEAREIPGFVTREADRDGVTLYEAA